MGRVTQRLNVIADYRPVTLCVEPWASEHHLAPNEQFVLEVEGPAYENAVLQVLHQPDRLVVHAWDGSDYRISNGQGKVVCDWTGIRVPDFQSEM